VQCVVNLTLFSQTTLIRKILDHNSENKKFLKNVYTMVRRIPALEVEVAGEDLCNTENRKLDGKPLTELQRD